MSWQTRIKREISSTFGNQLSNSKILEDRIIFYCPASFAYKILPEIRAEVKKIDPSLIITQVGGKGRSFGGIQIRKREEEASLRKEIRSIIKEQLSINDDIDVLGAIEDASSRIGLILKLLKNPEKLLDARQMKRVVREEIEQLYENIKSAHDFVTESEDWR